MSKKILSGPGGITLELDRSEWFPDDPGNGCPALVSYKGQTASLNCAIEEGYVWSDKLINLYKSQIKWLESQEGPAWEWITNENVSNEQP